MYKFVCYDERNLKKFKRRTDAQMRRVMNDIDKCVESKVERNPELEMKEERVLLKAFQVRLAQKLARSGGNFAPDVLSWH